MMKPSRRILGTDAPVIAQMNDMLRDAPADAIKLSQGVVFWGPPEEGLRKAETAAAELSTSAYCDTEGLPVLREALARKLAEENGLSASSVMVTAGANQAFANVVLSLCDADDAAVLFPPYYFNHLMALQMTGVKDIIMGARDPDTFAPDPAWIEETLRTNPKIRTVVVTNPCNPTGTVVPPDVLREIADVCGRHGRWLVCDNTYEYFVYDRTDVRHEAVEAPHVLNVFSFSKAYGMMGWRVGYLAYVDEQTGADGKTWSLGAQIRKAQDTIPICPAPIGQLVAVEALAAGRPWVDARLANVERNRDLLREALAEVLGADSVVGGEGAIYMLAKLPRGHEDDREVCRRLATEHGVVVIPASACGWEGHIRVAYANLEPEVFAEGVKRLKKGLLELVKK